MQCQRLHHIFRLRKIAKTNTVKHIFVFVREGMLNANTFLSFSSREIPQSTIHPHPSLSHSYLQHAVSSFLSCERQQRGKEMLIGKQNIWNTRKLKGFLLASAFLGKKNSWAPENWITFIFKYTVAWKIRCWEEKKTFPLRDTTQWFAIRSAPLGIEIIDIVLGSWRLFRNI